MIKNTKITAITSTAFQSIAIREVIYKKEYLNSKFNQTQTLSQFIYENEPDIFIKLLSKHYLVYNIETELVEIDDVKLHNSFYYIHSEQNDEKKYMADNGIVQVTCEEMFNKNK